MSRPRSASTFSSSEASIIGAETWCTQKVELTRELVALGAQADVKDKWGLTPPDHVKGTEYAPAELFRLAAQLKARTKAAE